jgi:hypothetical protein
MSREHGARQAKQSRTAQAVPVVGLRLQKIRSNATPLFAPHWLAIPPGAWHDLIRSRSAVDSRARIGAHALGDGERWRAPTLALWGAATVSPSRPAPIYTLLPSREGQAGTPHPLSAERHLQAPDIHLLFQAICMCAQWQRASRWHGWGAGLELDHVVRVPV